MEGVLLYNLGFKQLQTNVKIANHFKSFMLWQDVFHSWLPNSALFARKLKHLLWTKSVAPTDKLVKGWRIGFFLSPLGIFIIPQSFPLPSSRFSAFICFSITFLLLYSHRGFSLRSLQFYHLIVWISWLAILWRQESLLLICKPRDEKLGL